MHNYDLKFLKYAIKHYNNYILDYSDIAEIVNLSENNVNKLKLFRNSIEQNQINQPFEKLFKSAIEQNNIDLLGKVFNKTIETFKEDS
ncbi:9462_t:CDS:2 [Funneliformis mosseae]|uniref:9462_t:CDS:1 n=1 Tax=Funneliformis mosseae TaxID=27381 RepID=A0A9N8VEG7_FUNMO|nr:9462_t:CDS:2 [Funneliformis mosseae]